MAGRRRRKLHRVSGPALYAMGATRQQVVRQVVIKAALPEILTGMRVAIAFG